MSKLPSARGTVQLNPSRQLLCSCLHSHMHSRLLAWSTAAAAHVHAARCASHSTAASAPSSSQLHVRGSVSMVHAQKQNITNKQASVGGCT